MVPQPEPMQDTSTRKMKIPYNTVEATTYIELEMHDEKKNLEEITIETSSQVRKEDLDEMEVEESLSKILEQL